MGVPDTSVSSAAVVVELEGRPDLATLSQSLSSVRASLQTMKVKNRDDIATVTDLIARGKGFLKEWDDARKSRKAPYADAAKAIDGFFNPMTTDCKKVFKDKETEAGRVFYRLEEEARKETEKLQKEEARIKARLEKAGVDSEHVNLGTVEAEKSIRTASGTTYTTEVWHVEVKEPLELIKAVANGEVVTDVIDFRMKILCDMVRTYGRRSIPGCKVWSEKKAVTRRS